jgi:hypothetical protein
MVWANKDKEGYFTNTGSRARPILFRSPLAGNIL